ncbi:hypothetical protein ACFWYW_02595 [Nonomuraea sp. NPDC059023]|uniref:hypothetical protein n=1 Tax=unclassified Nonomuraea TaxID=2593643 RepID=UPI00367C961B
MARSAGVGPQPVRGLINTSCQPNILEAPMDTALPATARATLIILWLQTLIFTAGAVNFFLRVLGHRRGRTLAVVTQWVLAVVYALSFLLSLVGLFVTGDVLGVVVIAVMVTLPVTALVLLYKPATSAWFQGHA